MSNSTGGTQFKSRAGICFQWRTQGYWSDPNPSTKTKQLTTQYNTIIPYFRVIHTYQLCGWDQSNYTDLELPGAGTVLDLAGKTNSSSPVPAVPIQIVQGTLDGVFDNFVNNPNDAGNWANTLLSAFNGDSALAQETVGAIALGNEIDGLGTVNSDPAKLGTAIDKLTAGLAAAGLDSIPITSTFANIGTKQYPNSVAEKLVQTIYNKWQSKWNGGIPFVFANHYTDGFTSTDPTTATGYIENARVYYTQDLSMTKLQIFVGEMGYSSYDGQSNQATVDNAFFDWIGTQATGTPVCIFQAYDQPNAPTAREQEYGIFDTSTNQPKQGIDLSRLP